MLPALGPPVKFVSRDLGVSTHHSGSARTTSGSAHTTRGQRTPPQGQCTPPWGQRTPPGVTTHHLGSTHTTSGSTYTTWDHHTPLGVSTHHSGSAHTASGLLPQDLAELTPPAPPSAGACWSGRRDFLLQDSELPPRAQWPAEQAVPSIHIAHGLQAPHVPQGRPSCLGL